MKEIKLKRQMQIMEKIIRTELNGMTFQVYYFSLSVIFAGEGGKYSSFRQHSFLTRHFHGGFDGKMLRFTPLCMIYLGKEYL